MLLVTGYFVLDLYKPKGKVNRSRYPSGLGHALSSLARKPGSCVRIPLRAWMFGVCVYVCVCVCVCVCVSVRARVFLRLCTGRGLATS
jgi:hypothetical protein